MRSGNQGREAERSIREGVAVLRQCVATGSPVLTGARMEYRGLLKSQKRDNDIAALDDEMEAIRRGRPAGCAGRTVSVYGLMGRQSSWHAGMFAGRLE